MSKPTHLVRYLSEAPEDVEKHGWTACGAQSFYRSKIPWQVDCRRCQMTNLMMDARKAFRIGPVSLPSEEPKSP